ncbi:chromate transporter [Anaerobranca gottschalkii]|uniref:Chromate transporter n=1 Tax=Anaerobranca gottschalkii DSM 13577 TaxID=1120990 RepID=A0A1H9YQD7_9FIRM|nr:chromate transporter [Anaerobranca gottschalkii]SES71355.1 chromate transporter [Anaerobranca gottschalkii DSM 13577]
MELINLAIAFFKVGLLSIGGGYTLIPIIKNEVVVRNNWLMEDEFLQILGVTQGIPGAISVKLATYTGYKVAGILGVIVAVLSSMIVPVVLMLLLYSVLLKMNKIPYSDKFIKGVQFATVGLLISFAYKAMGGSNFDLKGIVLAFIAFLVMTFTKIDVAPVIIGAGVIGIFLFR